MKKPILFSLLLSSVFATELKHNIPEKQRYGYVNASSSFGVNPSLNLGLRSRHGRIGRDVSFGLGFTPIQFNEDERIWSARGGGSFLWYKSEDPISPYKGVTLGGYLFFSDKKPQFFFPQIDCIFGKEFKSSFVEFIISPIPLAFTAWGLLESGSNVFGVPVGPFSNMQRAFALSSFGITYGVKF